MDKMADTATAPWSATRLRTGFDDKVALRAESQLPVASPMMKVNNVIVNP